jgi:hypothetical protein
MNTAREYGKEATRVHLYIEAETRDKHGRVIHRMRRRRSRSFVQGYNWAVCAQFLNASSPSPALGPVRNTSGANQYLRDCGSPFRCSAGAGVTDTGIRVGTSSAAVAIDQYALQAPIAQGLGVGQMEHLAQTFSFIGVAGNQCSFQTQRVIVNNSGALIAVRETGIYILAFNNATTGIYLMAARDLISEDVPDGGSVTVTYTVRILA